MKVNKKQPTKQINRKMKVAFKGKGIKECKKGLFFKMNITPASYDLCSYFPGIMF